MHIVVVTTILRVVSSIRSRHCSILGYDGNLGHASKGRDSYDVMSRNEVDPGYDDIDDAVAVQKVYQPSC